MKFGCKPCQMGLCLPVASFKQIGVPFKCKLKFMCKYCLNDFKLTQIGIIYDYLSLFCDIYQ